MRSFRFHNVLLLAVLFGMLTAFKNDKGFPVPESGENMLFYVQRSLNKNTIIYELNLDRNNQLNEEEPIKMYWINYVAGGNTEDLNYIQRRYAYGLSVKMLDKEKKTFCFNFVSYKSQLLFLSKYGNSDKYSVFSRINNKTVMINRIYIHIEGGSFWFPKVRYVEVSGRDIESKETVTERVVIS